MTFSNRWFRKASDDELESERESIRLQYVTEADDEVAGSQQELLYRFDDEMIRRSNERYVRDNPDPQPRPHREHGWYLPNDD